MEIDQESSEESQQDPAATDDENDPEYTPELNSKLSKRVSKRNLFSYFTTSKSSSLSSSQDPQASTSSFSTCTTISDSCESDNCTENCNNPKSASALFDGKFFKIQTDIREKLHLKAECQLCLPLQKVIQGSPSSTANFLKHLRTKHPSALNDYIHYKKTKQQTRKKNSRDIDVQGSHKLKKLKQADIYTSFSKSKNICQEEFDQRILKFIINTMSAVSVLDNPSFMQIFDGMDFKIISRGTAMQRISVLAKKHLEDIKEKLENVQYVCTTADIWSSKKRSFLGVTCHWLNDENLERKSNAIACKRFAGAHTYDKIAEILEDIHLKFGLNLNNGKLVATVTDNGSNFVKAFKEYGVQISELNLQQCGENLPNNIDISSETEDEETSENVDEDVDIDENFHFLPTTNDGDDLISNFHLPNHIRCTSHTLNLIATTDLMNVINKNHLLRNRHTVIMNKCSRLWNKAGRPKSAEIIKETLGHYLSYPGVTRWNSYYDSISQILNEKGKLNILYENLDLKSFSLKDIEINYLEEYCEVLKPIAMALDILQGEAHTYYGYVIPTIASLKTKLEKIKASDLKYMRPVLDGCLEALMSRFHNLLNLQVSDAIIATVTHPNFKLRWVGLLKGVSSATSNIDINYMKRIVVDAAEMLQKNENTQSQPQPTTTAAMDFFEFDKIEDDLVTMSSSNVRGQIELQLLQYLQDPSTELKMLNNYMPIKQVFLKYNTPLPSSAPVERLFSYATFINTPRRHALSDKNFENLVLLKANKI